MHGLTSYWRKSLFVYFTWLLSAGFAIAASPAAPKPSLSDDCTGLLPKVIGEPRARSMPLPSLFWECTDPTSSRSGVLAFGLEYTEPSTWYHYWLYDSSDEREVGGFNTGGNTRGLYPPTDTFQQTRTRSVQGEIPVPNPTVASWTDRGEPIDSYELDPERRDSNRSTYQAAPDLIDGGVFLVYLRIRDGIGWQLEAWRFDKLATVLFGPLVIIAGQESPQSLHFLSGIDVNHNNLLLYQPDGSQPVQAVWFDIGGQTLSTRDFEIADFNTYRRGLTALLDGSFVMRRSVGSLRIPSWDEAGDVGPAPQWIEDHPLTDLYFIRGMRGYALAPSYSYPECEHEISVFAPDGTFCGSFQPEPSPGCGYGAQFVIGQDGTVFHESAEDVPCGSYHCGCTQHYWVGLLQ
jgi:hypothetical protein